jgi:hypothetical protein
MTSTVAVGAILSASFATSAGLLMTEEALTSSQQWTLLGILAAVLGAVWRLLNGIGNRMADSLDKHTTTVSANSDKIGAHTEKVGELVVEMRSLAAQNAVKAAMLERIDHSIERIPSVVADELARRSEKKA